MTVNKTLKEMELSTATKTIESESLCASLPEISQVTCPAWYIEIAARIAVGKRTLLADDTAYSRRHVRESR